MSASGFRRAGSHDPVASEAQRTRDRSRELRLEVGARREQTRGELDAFYRQLDHARALRTWPRRRGPLWQRRRVVSLEVWLRHIRYARTGDPQELAALVDEYRPDALRIVRRHHRDERSSQDLEQVAMEALVAALERFDPDRSVPFLGYGTPTIIGALKRYYRDNGWGLRVPRRVHELANPTKRVASDLTQHLGHEPGSEEIAAELGTDVETVTETAEALEARRVTSLDSSSAGSDQGQLAVEDERLTRVVDRVALRQAMAELPQEDRDVLFQYFVEERTQAEIAAEHNVSQMQVSRWLTAAVRRLRGRIA